jgi:aspartyl-tRNA(Asn)/glutamyl-tRNA(Gln) amidotransferase subunit A
MPSANDLLDAALAAIAEHNAATNAFILVDETGARAAARAVDDERRRGVDRGPLHGLPISVKDLIDVAGQPTTAGSRVRAGHVATSDAPIVRRLRDAGAVLIGKTNLHEFALGTTSEESAYGAVRNPHDTSRSAGGSSGGSAAAVASGMGVASIGSDTGGSIRIPAAACGVVGLKPSLGEVPTEGVVPLSTTFDHVGPLSRTVDDAAAVWAVIAGRPIPRLESRDARSLTFGLLGGYFMGLLGSEVRDAFENAVERLRMCGVTIDERTVQGTDTIVETYTSISLSEAARYHAPMLASRAADYQPPVRQRLEFGRTIPAVAYLGAMDTRQTLSHAVDAALDGCDALLLPALAIVAPPLGASEVRVDNGDTILVRAAMLRLTQLFNITGHPAISVPIRSSGLPVGLQLVGRRGQTEALLSTANTVVRALGQA